MSSKIIAGNATNLGVVASGATDGILELQTGSTPTTAVTIDASQNVGIGTTSPAFKLEVVDSNPRARIKASTTGYATTQYQNNNNTFWVALDDNTGSGFNGVANAACLYNNGATPMIFTTNATERMRILSDGGILLGTTTQNGANGISFSNASDTSSYGKSMYMNSPYNGTRNAISFAYNSSGVGQIVTGTSSVSYGTSSDYRLKENVQPMTSALDKVAQLKPVTYKWKLDGSDGQGFIAHELQAVVPDCVTGEKDEVEIVEEKDDDGNVINTKEVPKYQGVDTSFLVATLTAAIQELNAKVEAQALEIQALKGVA